MFLVHAIPEMLAKDPCSLHVKFFTQITYVLCFKDNLTLTAEITSAPKKVFQEEESDQ